METSPQDIESLRLALESPDAAVRRKAVEAAANAAQPAPGIAHLLERLALNDPEAEVRRAALAALSATPLAQAQRRLGPSTSGGRQFMLAEITALEKDGLLSLAQAQVLRGRYAVESKSPQKAAQAEAAGHSPQASREHPPSPSLSQLLLSETSVKIALYLGAFFVVAAAFILAALIEVARLPILGAFTVLFFVAALGLARRLPMASFVLFAVAALMVPITAGVLFDQAHVTGNGENLFWGAVFFLDCLIWVFGTRFYQSRLFSILAFFSLAMSAWALVLLLTENTQPILLTLGLAGMVGLFAAQWIGNRYGRRTFWPLFLTVQVVLPVLLFVSLIDLLFNDTSYAARIDPSLLFAAAVWSLAALFYLLSDHLAERFERWLPFALPAVTCGMAAPLLLVSGLRLNIHVLPFISWIWAAVLVLLAERLGGQARLAETAGQSKSQRLRLYPLALQAAAVLLFLFAGLFEMSKDYYGAGIVLLLAGAVLLTALSVRRPRWPLWTAALIYAYIAYLALQNFRVIQDLDLFPGLIVLPPTLALLALELFLRRRGASPEWWRPALVLGLLSSLGLQMATFGDVFPGWSALVFGLFAAFLLLYALLDRRPWVGYFSLALLALSLFFLLLYLKVDGWVAPLIGLAVLYDLIGLGLVASRRSAAAPPGSPIPATEHLVAATGGGGAAKESVAAIAGGGAAETGSTIPATERPVAAIADGGAQAPGGQPPSPPGRGQVRGAPSPWQPSWADVLQSSGLVLGALVSLAAPLQRQPVTIAAVALVASLYAIEAFRRDWIWLGFPTVALYFLAYAVALWELDIRQPQFYTIAAALLGMVMYHLLARRRHTFAALLTGLLAQLILLSTTYIQMVSADNFQFFFIMFFQALALLIYGLVVRSRSFVVAPLVALVIGVVTVALTVLSGLPTALIIGCTGILLLLLGILALLLRERLVHAADRWVGRLEMP